MVRPHGGKLVNRVSRKKFGEDDLLGLQTIPVTAEQVKDIENLADGVFSPLEGFLGEADLRYVLDQMRLSNDVPWTIPILLDVDKDVSDKFEEGDNVLLSYEGKPLALLHLDEKFAVEKKELAGKVFGTTDPKHPGVSKTLGLKDTFLSGEIELIKRPDSPFLNYQLSPMETRLLFKEKGWRTIVGFQTRNPPHIGHEYVQKTALTFVDGIFINPVIGRKKPGDFKDEVILKAYQELLDHYYLRERAVMSILQTEMRYAGPREAVFHAIIRKNYGCTHFIVGRDHAGVGNYYGPFEAQDIFEEFPDLGISPLFFSSFFHCEKCGGIANEKTCPHEDDRIHHSGTEIRKMIDEKKMPPTTYMRPEIAKVILCFEDPFI